MLHMPNLQTSVRKSWSGGCTWRGSIPIFGIRECCPQGVAVQALAMGHRALPADGTGNCYQWGDIGTGALIT